MQQPGILVRYLPASKILDLPLVLAPLWRWLHCEGKGKSLAALCKLEQMGLVNEVHAKIQSPSLAEDIRGCCKTELLLLYFVLAEHTLVRVLLDASAQQSVSGTCHAVNSSILKMATVVVSQWISRTVNESGLSSSTVNLIQPDSSSAVGNTKQSLGTGGGESQLSAHHSGIRSIPSIITHCAPDIVVADLYTSSGGSTFLKSDRSLWACCCIKNSNVHMREQTLVKTFQYNYY